MYADLPKESIKPERWIWEKQQDTPLAIVIVFSLFFVFLSNGMATGAKESTMKKKYFQGSDAEKMLEQAIRQDSAEGIVKAIKAGANPNTRGLYGVTPLEMAVGDLRKNAVAELLRQGVDMNVRDVERNNAITWAVVAYKRDPQILDMLLDAGADPNTLRADGDPIIVRFLADHDLNAIRYLHGKGANIDARDRSNDPLIIKEGIGQDWDSVWTLLELGAKFYYPNHPFTWGDIFSRPSHTPQPPHFGRSRSRSGNFSGSRDNRSRTNLKT